MTRHPLTVCSSTAEHDGVIGRNSTNRTSRYIDRSGPHVKDFEILRRGATFQTVESNEASFIKWSGLTKANVKM